MKTIFVSSHDQDWLFLINKTLGQAGYEVHFLDESNVSSESSPDLLILDTLNDAELSESKYVKFTSEYTSVPVFITSGDYTMKKKALSSGADQFLKKPFHTQNLISLIEKL